MVPQMKRKKSSDPQFGLNAHATVDKVNTVIVGSSTSRRPTVSLRGLNASGPTMYPMRNTEVGKLLCVASSTWNSCMM